MQTPLVVNIQKFSIHDGGGIRTTVFFKGCPLACKWCHNPETQSFAPQLLCYSERCTGCGRCIDACPEGCIRFGPLGTVETDVDACTGCGRCAAACPFDARETAGTPYTPERLAERLERDRPFYDNSGGGVTLSGGEALAQDTGFLLRLLQRLKRGGIHTAVDTCGDVPWECIEPLLPYIDLFLYDLKAVSPELHRRFTGRDNARILENLVRLRERGAAINLRIPVVSGFNDDPAELDAMLAFAKEQLPDAPVNLLPFHPTGRDKWERMGLPMPGDAFTAPTAGQMAALAERWRAAGFEDVAIGG